MLARNHEASTFALTCGCAALAGIPPLGCIVLAVVGAGFGDWPDIDMPRSRVTKALCLVRYPVAKMTDQGGQKRHEKGRRKGQRAWEWRSFPGHQLHLLFHRLSCLVFDLCATPDDRADKVPLFGSKFRSHRGLTHSLWFALGTGAAVWLSVPIIGGILGPWFRWLDVVGIFGTDDLRGLLAATAVVGTFGHVLGDCCTDFACAPFAPLVRWNGRRYVEMGLWEPMRFKVSKWVEEAIVTPICLGLAGASLLGALGWLSLALSALGRLWQHLA